MNFYYYKKYLSNYLVKYFLNENKHKTTEIRNIIIKCESREVLKIILSLLRLYKSLCPAVHRCTCTSPTIPSEIIRGLHHAFYNSLISTHLLISVAHYLGNRQISISSRTRLNNNHLSRQTPVKKVFYSILWRRTKVYGSTNLILK